MTMLSSSPSSSGASFGKVDVVDALEAGTEVDDDEDVAGAELVEDELDDEGVEVAVDDVEDDEVDDVVEDEEVEELVEDPTVVDVGDVDVPEATVVDVVAPPGVVVVDVACGAYVTDDVVPDTKYRTQRMTWLMSLSPFLPPAS